MSNKAVPPLDTEIRWRGFAGTLLTVTLTFPLLLYLFIILVDPHDNLPFSPDWPRVQVSGGDRYFKPSVARRPQYDSVLIGSSSSMLLHPGRLSGAFGARFATLAMPAASPYEQMRLLGLFRRHHPAPRHVLVGVDKFWCHPDPLPKLIGANQGQTDPDWLYDENPWNDWPALDSEGLKFARRQVRDMLDPALDPAGQDGYYNFTLRDYGSYDLERARQHVYGMQGPVPFPATIPPLERDSALGREGNFPNLPQLAEALNTLPQDTVKLVFFPPNHWYNQFHGVEPARQALVACKHRVAAMGERLNNFFVLDFMRVSPITRQDRNYWDQEHYTDEVARALETMLSQAVKDGRVRDEYYDYLWPAVDPAQN